MNESVITDPERFDVVLPDPDPKASAHGFRIRLTRDIDDASYVSLSEEVSLPEKVADVKANRVEVLDEIAFSVDQLRWLRDRFNEILGEVPQVQRELAQSLVEATKLLRRCVEECDEDFIDEHMVNYWRAQGDLAK